MLYVKNLRAFRTSNTLENYPGNSMQGWPVNALLPNKALKFFPQFQWEIMGIRHCISWRRTAWWFDLPVLWNDCHKRFSWHPCSHTDTIKRKIEKNLSFRGELLGFTLLTTFLCIIQQCELQSACYTFHP